MNEEQEEMQAELSPEYQKYMIQEQVKAEAETKRQLAEMEQQIAYSEKLSLRDVKKEAFRMAIQIKPQPTINPMGAQMAAVSFSTEDLIISANKIYNELIK